MRESNTSNLWRKLTGSTCFAALIATGALTPTAYAQEAEEAFGGLEEIVITASKREQTLQEAGMAVTAIGAQDLERMGATEFADFAVRVPNLGFGNESDGRFNSNSPAIRGVFGANTTGFYIDDTPVPMSVQPRVIDVSRVEVLRGPQGSLYGARSMGGTIRLITQQPEYNETFGSAHATLSTVKEGDINWSVDASVNLPVIEDKLAVRVTGYYGQNSGVYDRVYKPTFDGFVINDLGEGAAAGPSEDLPPAPGLFGLDEWVPTTFNNPAPAFDKNENVDDERYGGFQLTAKAEIAENLTFIPKFMYQKIEADGLPFADISPENFTQERYFDEDEAGMERWWLASGTLKWDMDTGSITSSTSYFDRFLDEGEEEATFLTQLLNTHPVLRPLVGFFTGNDRVNPISSIITENEAFTSFVHETRYTSAYDGPFQFTAGVFYQRTKNHLQYPPALAIGLDAETGGLVPGDLIFQTENFFNTKEYAVFGEATYDITEAVSITAGGRYYKTETDAFIESDGFANDGPSRVPGDLSLDKVKQSETGFNPKVLVQANVSEEMDVYASASKGFRIGGANGNLPATLCGAELTALNLNPADVQTYDSDSLWSYEAGVKSTLADNRVSLNAAAYLIKWSDISQQNRLGCGFQYIANAGKAEIKGFEVEMMAAPIDGLTLTFALGYADAKITDPEGVAGVLAGDELQGVPNWTVAASGEYIFPVGSNTDGILRADFNHYGRSFSTNNGDQRTRPAWTALNLRAGVIRDDWEVTLFVDNLTNTHANMADSRSIAAETSGRQRVVSNRPRTIGLDVRTRF
ncbi:TonB-dependent receptor [Paremcibacter congregatus]|uniref:TonB-dependent receptor n=1 Tax=Paremcibacter congregatus TaxID=2043170 RepID=UPI0030EDF928|tara:strand:+ start:5379 stop:7799 length:2421 start_codon:yes stop_codon:yes gene_type:complete